jgi:hypothetical protein
VTGEAELRDDGWSSTLLFALSAVALGLALQISSGMLHPLALIGLSIAFALCAVAVAMSRQHLRPRLGRWSAHVLPLVLLGGLILQLVAVGTMAPTFASASPPPSPFRAVLLAIGVLAVMGAARVRIVRQVWFPVVLILHAVISGWIVRAMPLPTIDVFLFQQDGSAALMAGANPYTLRFPDIYPRDAGFYGPGLSVNGWLTFGFPYFPLSAILVVPGQSLAGDFRYAHVAAVTIAGALMGYARPGPVAMLAACLYLFTPRVFHILHQGWTEPLVVLLLAATVFCACRVRHAAPYTFGLFLAVKQYLVLAVPLAWMLAAATRLSVWALLVRSALVAAAVTLPFLFWDPRAFIESVVTLQFYQPFRHDALSYPAWIASRGGPPLGGVIAFVPAAVAVIVSVTLAARTPAGTAGAIALVYFAFFAFNKQAFANYYFFVVGALCCAVGAARVKSD